MPFTPASPWVNDPAGATNANFVWCPDSDKANAYPNLSLFYPGDAYVDWIALDGYRRPPSESYTPEAALGTYGYDRAALLGGQTKPMMFCEWGTTEFTAGGYTKAQWIARMMQIMPTRFPRVRAVVYYDKDEPSIPAYWPLDSTVAATNAWKDAVAVSVYKSDVYASLSGDKIAAP